MKEGGLQESDSDPVLFRDEDVPLLVSAVLGDRL
jgi:hypothetical protein